MAFSESAVQSGLEKLNDNSNIWVAYSGGMDSHVLLHLMVRLLPSQERRLRALHINHGISPHAADWQSHCQQTCSDLGIPFQAVSVSLDADGTDSLETRARKARYRVFADRLGPGDYLFLAHHLDDQIETMLFRLLRGTGLKGLAGMPVSRPLGAGQLYRPLLALARDELEQYAIEHRLQWIEDDSNARADYDRNYLRLKVLPLLEKRWPGYKNNWLRTAQICAEAETLLSEQAGHDLSLVQTEHPTRLQIEALQRFSRPRQRQILRYWLAGLATEYGFPQADYNCLERILHELLPAPDDANPLVSWSNNESAIQIRRFAGALYALAPFTEEAGDKQLNWLLPAPLELGAQLGRLELVPVATDGIDLDAVSHLTVAFREGGEVAKAAGRKTRSLKKIFQDYRVPPWLRSRIPLLYLDGELLAVADLFITSSRHRKQGKNLYRFHWSRPDIHCGY